ncbi:alpha/beta fold hydrolase [Amycolatopsis sp. NPDC051903]|uniref:alpha/beta fold hydrolase n=1 Tax=Amycolatopsis sp. NPDC051903 TaxID=3363936 RepID=UPI0037929454
MAYVSDSAPTLRVEGKLATYAYRDFGQRTASPPLVLLQRFRGTLDHWDPAFLEPLAARRRVVLFDSAGVNESSGTVPDTIEGMAAAAADFLEALGFTEADLFGWSMGGFVAQLVALEHPGLVRRLAVTGSGPGGGVPGVPDLDPRVPAMMTAETNTDDEFLYLFFGLGEAAQQVGRESLARLEPRLNESKADVSAEAWGNQLRAILRWGSGEGAAWPRLRELEIPVLVANGAHDVMVPSVNSFAMAQRLTDATTVFNSDAGHAFLFQHPDEFARVVLDFLG